jgi:hypothetical protein
MCRCMQCSQPELVVMQGVQAAVVGPSPEGALVQRDGQVQQAELVGSTPHVVCCLLQGGCSLRWLVLTTPALFLAAGFSQTSSTVKTGRAPAGGRAGCRTRAGRQRTARLQSDGRLPCATSPAAEASCLNIGATDRDLNDWKRAALVVDVCQAEYRYTLAWLACALQRSAPSMSTYKNARAPGCRTRCRC